MMVETVPAALPFITAGQLRPLAVTTAKRISFLPDVPTGAEVGMPSLEVSSTFLELWCLLRHSQTNY
jgi:tripartite-type tricarboxylate transporter receptor subunit TctC